MRPQLEARLREVHPRGLHVDPDRDAISARTCGVASVMRSRPSSSGSPDSVSTPGTRTRKTECTNLPSLRLHIRRWTNGLVVETTCAPPGSTRTVARTPSCGYGSAACGPLGEHTFNLWRKRGETGYLDANVAHVPPDPGWLDFMAALEEAFYAAGIETLGSEERYERVPFVLTEAWPEDVGDDDSENSGPDHKEPLVAQCLFDDYS
jgi:hypothetical protein